MADGTPFSRGYTWTKSVLQVRGLVSKAPKRSAHRKKRARRPLPGLLLFQDGSKHAWLPQGPELDLVVTLDDATSAMLSAVLVEEEGTASSFMRLSGISCVGGHDGWKGAQPCRDAKSLISLMPFWTSFWLGPIPRRPLIRTAFSTA